MRELRRCVVDAVAPRAPGHLEERGRFIAGAIARSSDDLAHDVVGQAECEAVVADEHVGELGHAHPGGPRPLAHAADVDDATAAVAHRVIVELGVRVETQRATRERARGAEAGFAQCGERVVYGGEAHRRQLGQEPFVELLGRGMRGVGGELAHDRHALRRQLQAFFANALEEAFDDFVMPLAHRSLGA